MIQEPCKKCGEYHNNCYEFSELTDEEILKVAFKERIRTHDIEDDWGNVCIDFARAILRKAQEK